jgi:hypothetical protein
LPRPQGAASPAKPQRGLAGQPSSAPQLRCAGRGGFNTGLQKRFTLLQVARARRARAAKQSGKKRAFRYNLLRFACKFRFNRLRVGCSIPVLYFNRNC